MIMLSIIGNRVDTTRKVPSWMNNIKKQECLRLGNYFYHKAITAIQHKANGATVNGKWISNTNLMQRAMDYYNAAASKDIHSRTQKANSRTLQHFVSTIEKPEEKHVSSIKNNMQHTSHLGKIEKIIIDVDEVDLSRVHIEEIKEIFKKLSVDKEIIAIGTTFDEYSYQIALLADKNLHAEY